MTRRALPQPVSPTLRAPAMYRLQRAVAPNRFYDRLAEFLETHPRLRRMFTGVEEKVKARSFGCRMCGQCALPVTGYVCPMTCPKQLRNGPCGGVSPNGDCEVYPGLKCVWLIAFERAEASGHADDLMRLQRPIDHREWGKSSWVNYWRGRDEQLWTQSDGLRVLETVARR